MSETPTNQKLRRCGECRERAVAPSTNDVDEDFGWGTIKATDVPCFRCSNCGAVTYGMEGLSVIQAAIVVARRNLTP